MASAEATSSKNVAAASIWIEHLNTFFTITHLHKDEEALLPALPNILPKSPQIPVKTSSTHRETKASPCVITEKQALIDACCKQFIIFDERKVFR